MDANLTPKLEFLNTPKFFAGSAVRECSGTRILRAFQTMSGQNENPFALDSRRLFHRCLPHVF